MMRAPAPRSPRRPLAASALVLTSALWAALSGCAAGAAPPPVPGGPIATLPIGTYTCEMPGDAGGAAGKPVADHVFRIVNSSSYKVGAVRGSYLFVGDRVTMTGGTLKGLRLHRISSTFLRQVKDDGSDGEMRCVLTSHR
jgi:hypothetical protein